MFFKGNFNQNLTLILTKEQNLTKTHVRDIN
jgi:hypothetical protein